MAQTHCIDLILTERGIRRGWLAEQLGISASYMTLLLQEKRRWTDALKDEAARVLMLPRDLLFFEGDYRRDAMQRSAEPEKAPA